MRRWKAAASVSRTLDGRVGLPRETASRELLVGAVGRGWVEMTDDPRAPALTLRRARVDERRRLSLPRGGVAERFAAAPDEAVLTIALQDDEGSGHTWFVSCTIEHALRCFAASTRPPVLTAPGWEVPWIPGPKSPLEASAAYGVDSAWAGAR